MGHGTMTIASGRPAVDRGGYLSAVSLSGLQGRPQLFSAMLSASAFIALLSC